MKKLLKKLWRSPRKPSCVCHTSRRVQLEIEALEERIVPSWAGVPPTQITPPTSSVSVSLNRQGDATGNAAITNNEVDYYSFTAATTGAYRLSATTPTTSYLDTVLGVFNSSGQRVAYNDDISSTNSDSNLTVNLTAGRKYYFGITNYSGSYNGTYSWLVDGPSSGPTDDAYEPNNSFGVAANLGTLTSAKSITGLVMADSQDWFKFTMNGSGSSANYVRVSFQNASGDLDMALYNAGGTRVGLANGTGNTEQISLSGLASGTYYIQVYGYQGVTNPNYTLDINPGTRSTVPPGGVVYKGGPLLQHVEVETVYYGSVWASSGGPQRVAALDQYVSYITNSSYMDMLNEYGVGRGRFLDHDINTSNPPNGNTVDDRQLQSMLDGQIRAGRVQAPTANRLYFIFTGPGVLVTAGNANSRNDFLGYHSAFTSSTGQTIYYAVIPFQGGVNAIAPNLNDFQSQTEVMSHELAEAVTDPLPPTGWIDPVNGVEGEIGDKANLYYAVLNGYVVQQEWSNAAGGIIAPAGSQAFSRPTSTATAPLSTGTLAGSLGLNGPLSSLRSRLLDSEAVDALLQLHDSFHDDIWHQVFSNPVRGHGLLSSGVKPT